jgi:hypothetical protein
MTVSRASMQQQLKGNRMPTYRTKKGDNIKTIKPISRTGQKLLGMKNVRKTTKKNVGGFLETFSPAYSIAKGKGPISEMASKIPGLGLAGMVGKLAKKQRKKAGSDAMKAEGMAGADRMSGGGKVVKSRRTRSIDGIATRGKTRGTQR